MRKIIRKLRHWKQRFDKNAEFIFRRRLVWGGKTYVPGDPIPKALAQSPTKLRRFWESSTVELTLFEDPDVADGQVAFVVDTPEVQEVLYGSNILDAVYVIEGEDILLGDIVGLAYEDSGLTIDEWNDLSDKDREALLALSLSWMQDQGPDDDWLNGED